ncbi:restriction endonuclease subunit S [Empedobacter falsenii]|uniref:Restriction endonuclease subunit S n=1 Tax=Empedobacter falsenii TaxID=343874 RepID=A0A3R8TMR6_9FLAO|nr:restriction endonuclease subunit S [Empedobacter falsenii]RRT86402.1 restriction endonuclease subunit S [Empedobacter falsenii]RRT87466.1 restriction endonuclease subunit S [Empedobacter falsenii]
MSYKKLGEYIEVIDDRNRDLLDLPLLGVSVQKVFIPSIANTVGTDMSKYKILSKNQFTYIPDTSRRGDKIGVALLKNHEKALVSQAYTTFKIIDEEKLNPDYLMMWFSRPEFDRYARYHSIGSVREVFDWTDMCEVELPIPSIEKQREIVAQYEAVANKIKVNEAICEKLEATAQALYKHWFVDFEFPNEEGQPYKSSGGAMVFNEELEKEIPEDWEVGLLSDLITVKYGKDYKHLNVGKIPLYGSGGIMSYVDSVLYDKPSVLIPRKGSLNNILYVKSPFWSVDTMFYSIPKIENVLIYIFNALSRMDFNSLNVGSAVPSMTTEYLNSMLILIPSEKKLKSFESELNKIEEYKISINKQNQKLTQLQSLLLSRLARLEG